MYDSPIPPPSWLAGRDYILGAFELHRDAVHAVAQSSWLWTVVEDVAEMPPTACAVHLGAANAERPVDALTDRVGQVIVEARPTGAAVELRSRREERQGTARAGEHALTVLIVEGTRKRRFGASLAQYRIGGWRQALAPLGIGQF